MFCSAVLSLSLFCSSFLVLYLIFETADVIIFEDIFLVCLNVILIKSLGFSALVFWCLFHVIDLPLS